MIKLVLLKEARDFLHSLPNQVHKKITYNIDRVLGGERNAELFKKIENADVWEFRTLYNGKAYRLFAFWDKDGETLIIATHGIVKNVQRTPRKEIAKAEAMRKEYFMTKSKK